MRISKVARFHHKPLIASVRRPMHLTTQHSRLVIVRTQYPGGILELSEESIEQALLDARVDLSQLFDETVGITGVVKLVDLDGPSVTLGLKGRFWHKREDVISRMRVYLQERIPEILEVEIDDPTQLDDTIIE